MSDRRERGAPAPPVDRPFEPGIGPEQRETVVALFGDSTRSGAWLPPDRLNAAAGFGDVKLDFCEAELPAGATEVRAIASFGDVRVRGVDR